MTTQIIKSNLMRKNQMIRVGIPRALIYYKFSEMWITFFKKLGAKVIVSPPTTKAIKEDSVRFAPNECLLFYKTLFWSHFSIKR